MAGISPFATLDINNVKEILESSPELGLSLLQYDKNRNVRYALCSRLLSSIRVVLTKFQIL